MADGARPAAPRSRMRIATRSGLGFLGLAAAFLGVWATADPAGFFAGFPGLGIHWVDLLPPYNEHLVRDVGGLYLGQAVILIAAAVMLDARMTRVALVAYLVTAIPHVAFHAAHLDGWRPEDAVGEMATLGLLAVLPAILLVLDLRASPLGTDPSSRTRREPEEA